MGEPLPGPASLTGLAWLARVGPAPIEAWRSAMGWSLSVAGSHARRLERAGWLARHRMTRGQGSLLVATRRGVRMSGLAVRARRRRRRRGGRTTARARGRPPGWRAAGEMARSARGAHGSPTEGRARMAHRNRPATRGHRPDLAVVMPTGSSRSRSSCSARQTIGSARSSAVRPVADERRITGLIYVCRDEPAASGSRVGASGRPAGRRVTGRAAQHGPGASQGRST